MIRRLSVTFKSSMFPNFSFMCFINMLKFQIRILIPDLDLRNKKQIHSCTSKIKTSASFRGETFNYFLMIYSQKNNKCTCDLSQFYHTQPGKCRHGVIMPIRHIHTHPCSQGSLSHTYTRTHLRTNKSFYLCGEILHFRTSVPIHNQLFFPFVMKVNFYNHKLCVSDI